jgi:ferredoxin
MRFHWFLPALRKPKGNEKSVQRNWLTRVAKCCLPTAFFSDWGTKRRGLLRRWLRWMGLSWVASPVRRFSQTLCFAVFLALFFYVCWPYDAVPRQSWQGFVATDVDPETGRVSLVSESATEVHAPTSSVFLQDASGLTDPAMSIGPFQIEGLNVDRVDLAPTEALSDDQIAELLLSPGPWVLFDQDPESWPSHYAENLNRKELLNVETFLILDPLVSLSTAIASRTWVWSLVCASLLLAVSWFIPRGFCGYLCPLGTLIDLFDWQIGRRFKRFRIEQDGWWVHLKYYLLGGILVAAAGGVLVSGMFAAIPVITRGFLFTFGPLQNGLANGWHQVPPMNPGHVVSLLMFLCVLALGFLRPRFWCKYVCPSGALFSVSNLFRVTERKVEDSCIHCNKCVEICPFDAIKPDFTTRGADCTFCQSCGGVCPTHAIKFVERWNHEGLKILNDPPTNETPLGRRGFLASSVGVVTAIVGGVVSATVAKAYGAGLGRDNAVRPVRPPGSVPEQEFLEMCIRCGACFKACPSDVLQPLGFEQGIEGLWTPQVVPDWAGCSSSCNACGQVCPTGAIRALPLEEKKAARMGLAWVNESTCLPFADREDCQLCVDECQSAGYNAIEFVQVGTEVDEAGIPLPGTGRLAPVVLEDQCVGCGLCQTRCYGINVAGKGLLESSAIVIEAGDGKEDRLMDGSYVELRRQKNNNDGPANSGDSSQHYLPDFLKVNPNESDSP